MQLKGSSKRADRELINLIDRFATPKTNAAALTALDAAAHFLTGKVTSKYEGVNEILFNVVASLVNSDEDITDEICASATLSQWQVVSLMENRL